MSLYEPAALALALRRLPGFAGVAPEDLEELGADGIAHLHVRIRGRARLVRIPRFSQVATSALAHLDYQAACFRRALPAGVTPRLEGVLVPGPGLPMGGLVVEEIQGRVPRLPDDLGALADSLAKLHALAVPADAEARAPLVDHAEDPAAGAWANLARQATLLEDGPVAPQTRTILFEELGTVRTELDRLAGTPEAAALIALDCHPGNFLIEPGGRAVLVDLERVQYGSPANDLAHATLPTSTLWDRRIDTQLSRREVEKFYRQYRRAIDPATAARLKPWLGPYRRLIFLRSATWFVRFVAETRAGRWSAGSLDPAFLAEVERRIRRALEPPRLEAMRAEWRGRDPFNPADCF